MKQILSIIIMGLVYITPLNAQAKVNIFACEPEWAALAEEIGGQHVKIFSATHARQNAHYIRARPSLITKARRADLIICSGGGLEAGWLPILLQKAKANTQRGTIGYLMAIDYVPVLEKPLTVDRAQGDIHPEGNPHVHLNPHNISMVAQELTKRLASIDAPRADFYHTRLQNFTTRWQQAITNWQNQAASLKGKTIIVHHSAFSYLLDWLGMEQAASLEPKPGIPPTTSHLEKLLQQFKTKPAHAIIRTPYEPDNASLWLSKKTAIPAIALPYTIGGDAQSDNLFALFTRSIALLNEVVLNEAVHHKP